jgi:hypothetical protein
MKNVTIYATFVPLIDATLAEDPTSIAYHKYGNGNMLAASLLSVLAGRC